MAARYHQETGQDGESWVGQKPQLSPPTTATLCKAPRGKNPTQTGRSWAEVSPGVCASWRKSELLGCALAAPRIPFGWRNLLHIPCFSENALRVVLRHASPLPAAVTSFSLECQPCASCWGTPILPPTPSSPEHGGAVLIAPPEF